MRGSRAARWLTVLVGCCLTDAATHAEGADGRGGAGATRRREHWDLIPAVHWARLGALERIDRPGCQAVLTDFTDTRGRRLDDVLRESGRTAREQLDSLELQSGLGRPRCRGAVMAFTRLRSSVVSICLSQFRTLGRHEQEAILIHEMLHSLGLGENPPESAAITAQVMKRCVH
jgi:hypothetical protein